MMDLQQYGTHTACSVLQAQPAGWAWEVVFALLINLPLLGSQIIITHTHTTQDKSRTYKTVAEGVNNWTAGTAKKRQKK